MKAGRRSRSIQDGRDVAVEWLHVRRTKLLAARPSDDPPQPTRCIEVDVIVASRARWDASAQKRGGDWDEVALGAGLVFAEKTIG
jgi:hypothetical protein